VYLTYSLVTRLAAGKPTFFATSISRRYVFLESGAYVASGLNFEEWNKVTVDDVKDGLILFDFNTDQGLETLPRGWKAVIASSSKPDEIHKWAKEKNATIFFMKTWSEEEILNCR